MNLIEAQSKLKALNQEHLLNYWSSFTKEEQSMLLLEIEALDPIQLKEQLNVLHQTSSQAAFTSFRDSKASGNKEDEHLGAALIKQGRVGCIVVAGGQGTRLGFEGPKGCFPLPGTNQTLFELIAKQTKGPLAIMTSPLNDAATRDFWEKQSYFGLRDVSFFAQGMLPFLDPKGKLLFGAPGNIACGPNGNGDLFQAFEKSGLLSKWRAKGIESITIIPVDNVLADPFDPKLIGFHTRKRLEVTVKATERASPKEKVGVLVLKNKRLHVVEYSELPLDAEGSYLANLGLFCFSLSFVEEATKQLLPLHKAHKKIRWWDPERRMTHDPDKPNGWKFERFIFDALPLAADFGVLVYPRNHCFAPIKNARGEDSPETAVQALEAAQRRI